LADQRAPIVNVMIMVATEVGCCFASSVHFISLSESRRHPSALRRDRYCTLL